MMCQSHLKVRGRIPTASDCGSIQRECLDHAIVLGEKHLRRILKSYFDYYLGSRTHLSLAKDAPTARVVQGPEAGQIVAIPQVGGLHHRYERRAA
jgi:putative transposase